jgi:hypothetical protein
MRIDLLIKNCTQYIGNTCTQHKSISHMIHIIEDIYIQNLYLNKSQEDCFALLRNLRNVGNSGNDKRRL